jgi:REP element-mobilizing transposase RayT
LVVDWGRIDRGEADHVHLLVRYPPTLAISLLVQRLKGRIAEARHCRSSSNTSTAKLDLSESRTAPANKRDRLTPD